MKSKIFKQYGGTEAKVAKELGLSQQRINTWPEQMTKAQIDGVIAALVRKGMEVPKWLR